MLISLWTPFPPQHNVEYTEPLRPQHNVDFGSAGKPFLEVGQAFKTNYHLLSNNVEFFIEPPPPNTMLF